MNPSHVLSAYMQTGKGLGTFYKPKLWFTVMDCGGGGVQDHYKRCEGFIIFSYETVNLRWFNIFLDFSPFNSIKQKAWFEMFSKFI